MAESTPIKIQVNSEEGAASALEQKGNDLIV
jgi:hypothetical protein